MDKKTGRGFISRKKLIHIIKVNSRKEKKLGSGFLKLLKKNFIKVSSKSLLKRARGYNCFQMAIYIQGNIKMENSMAKANIFGLMDLPTQENSQKATERVKENGFRASMMGICTQEATKKIKKKEKANTYGIKDACSKGSLKQT